jgi:predicted membrane chloride channel (bestrophin family)
MMSAIFEVIVYLVGEMLAYAFTRLFLCIMLTVCAVFIIRWLVPDQTVFSALSVFVALLGLAGGIAWEVRAAKCRSSAAIE